MTELACLFLFPLNTNHVEVARSDKKNIYNDFFGILKFVLAFLKPNCNEVVLFVIAEVFHKWKNANEKIFSDLVVKNSICGFHGYVTAKLKCWLSFKNLNEQMVSDTRKFHFSSSSTAQAG